MATQYPNNLLYRVVETYDPVMDRLDIQIPQKQILRNRRIIDKKVKENKKELEDLINKTLTVLTDREKKIIIYREKEHYLLRECADIFGISNERVRQIQAVGYRKLRKKVADQYINMIYKGQ